MSFSALTQFAPGDSQGMHRWALEHYLEHVQFNTTIQNTFGVAPLDLPLQVIEDPKEWLAVHQLVSQSQWTMAGGGQSVNLEDVQWDDENQLLDWFNIHASWHFQLRQSLGL